MSENTIAYLVVVAIMILWHVFRSSRSSARGQAQQVYRQANLPRARDLAALAAHKLEAHGMSGLMLSDYRFSTKIGEPGSTPIADLETQLQSALMEMLAHLHLMPDIRLLVTDDPGKLSGSGRLGEYVHNYGTKEIHILVDKKWDAKILLSGLCHECSHYFMYSYGLNHSDPQYNEGLTDTMACMVGFSETMIAQQSNRPLPYLCNPEFLEVKKYLLERRAQLQKARDEKTNLATARAQLKKNLAGARDMKRQAEAVIAVKKTPTRRIPKTRFSNLQSTLLSLESGAYDEAFRRAEAAQSGDLSRVKQADAELLEICANLYTLLLAFNS